MNNANHKKSNWKNKTEYLLQYSAQNKVPVSGTFELTSRCNLSCKFCYVKHNSSPEVLLREKSANEWKRMGRQLADNGTVFLLLTGGEPLIRKDFKEIYQELNAIGFHIVLHTNGTLIDEEFIKWFSPIRASKVAVTLYGASSETYKKTTGTASGFSKALNGIDLLLKEGIITEIRSPITKLNIHEAKKISRLGSERGIAVRFFNTLIKNGRGISSETTNVRLTGKEVIALSRMNQTEQENNSFSREEENYITLIQNSFDIPGCNDSNPIPSAMKCMGGKSSFLISWDGKMLPCALMEEPATLPFDYHFLQSWEELVRKTAKITGPAECSRCSLRNYCEVCPAKLQAETGSFNKLSPYICEIAKTKKYIFDHITPLHNENAKEKVSETQTGNH